MAYYLRNSVQHARGIWTSIGAAFGGISARIRPRLAGLRVLPLRIATFAIAFAFPLFGAGGLAHADMLVSNIGQNPSPNNFPMSSLSEYDSVQGFRTGPTVSGYELTSIEIRFASGTTAPTVKLLKDSQTGTEVATLAAPSSFGSGNRTFTVPDPDNPPVLVRDTTYYVSVSGGSAILDMTNQRSEDADGKFGWNIHNRSYRRGAGTTEDWLTANAVVRIRVNGTEIPPKVSSVAVTSTPRAAADNTYGVGQRIEFTVTFDQRMIVTGDPHFEFLLSGTKSATFIGGSGTNALVFGYTVQASDIDANGIYVGDHTSTIKLDSDEHIRGKNNRVDADFTHSQLGTLSGHKVDGRRAPRSLDATLSALSLGTGVTLSPAFASDVTAYRAWVANGVSSVRVTSTPNDDGATVVITPGTATIPLTPGRNQIAVEVTAEFPSVTEEYTVTVVREASAPVADPNAKLTANVTVGEGSGTVGYSGGSPGWGAMTETRFRVGGKTYDFRAVVLAGDAPASPFNANTVALCFGAREPENIVRNSLTLSIDGHDFAFEGRSRLGTSRCYDWTRPVDLDWAWGDIALVKLSGNLPPNFGPPTAIRMVVGLRPANENVGAPVEAVDPDDDVLTYTLEGADRDNFTIDASGQIKTLAPLDPQAQNTHQVTVKADDGKGGTGTIDVTITVMAIVTEAVVTSIKGPRYSTTSLVVRWTAPVRVDALVPTGYAVQYREGTSGPWRPHPHSGTATLTQIGSLNAGAQYQVRVQALYGEGVSPSEWSEPRTGRVRTVVEDASFGTLGATIYQIQYPGTVPGAHFGASFEVKVRFTNPLTYRHEITDITGPNGEIFINPGPELADMIGPDRGIWVTSGTVESINIFDRRLLVLNVQPSGNDDVTLTLEPLPCNEQGALCSGQEGLADRVRYTIRGVKDVPPAPKSLELETVQEGGNTLMKVFFDGTNEATKSRVQWKFPDQEWSEAEEHRRWWSVGPEDRHLSVSARVNPAFAYDVRARWESPIGEGPWAYTTRAGVPQAQWGETIRWYQNFGTNGNVNGAEVHIEYGRALNIDAPIDLFNNTGTTPPFRVAYSESRVLGHSVRGMRIIDTTDDGTYNPRTVKLTLSGVIRGRSANSHASPHTGEQVYVTYTENTGLPVRDKAGNPAPAFNSLPATFVPGAAPAEFRRPSARPVSGQLISSGNQIYVTFDWKLSPLGIPSPSAFTVKVDGTPIGTIFAPDRFTIFDENVRNIRLGVSPRIRQRRTVTVTYNKPNNANKALRDRAGNQVDSFEDFEMTNNSDLSPSSPGIGPAPALAVVHESGQNILLTMDEAIDRINKPSRTAFTITVDGTDHTPSSVLEGPGTHSYILYLPTTINRGQEVTISYTDANPHTDNATDVIQDTDGNDGPSFVNFAATHNPSALSVADAEATEGADTTLDFVVTLDPAASTRVRVDYTTSDGTATQDNDYTATSGTLTFAPGETTKTVFVPIADDSVDDDGETLTFALSNPLGAVLADAEATGTIRNTEGSQALTAEFRSLPEDGHGRSAFTFELRFSEEIPLSYVTLGASAFQVTNGTVSAAGRAIPGKNQTWQIEVTPSGTKDVTITLPATTNCADTGAICAGDSRMLSAKVSATVPETASVGTPFRVRLEGVPREHAGTGEIVFEVEFTKRPKAVYTYVRMRNSTLKIRRGDETLTPEVRRLNPPHNDRWEVTVEPGGNADLTVSIGPFTSCTDTGAVCTDEDEVLSNKVEETIHGPATPSVPFRVRLEGVPREHAGTGEIVFEVEFTKRPKAVYTYVRMRNSTLKIRRGDETLTPEVRRLNRPHNDRWEVTVEPGSKADLTVSIGPFTSCTDTGAVCTDEDEVLSNKVEKTILGPPGLSVSDARVHESEVNAAVAFTVTLSRAASETVTVDYATSDGTAEAGSDYQPTSDTLTFAVGDTVKTVSVAVLDDAVDEAEETFTLTLFNPDGGNAWLADDRATGTIENSDPMPRAWLARFGRTAAVHVLDAVEERLDGGSNESWVRLGGHQLGGVSPQVMESARRLAPERSLWDAATSLDPAGQDMSLDQLFLGSAFHLVSNAEDNPFGPRLSAWGRVATSGFDGEEDRTALSGTVTTATLGVDGVFRRWLTGVALAYSAGDGSFTHTEAPGGDLSSTLTSVHPYVGYALSDRVKLWGMVGYGSGSLELSLVDRDPLRTDIDMTMGALGVRGVVMSTAAGFELALRSDVLWVSTGSAAVPGMVETEADTSRVRLVLEGSRSFRVGEGGLLTPTLELGLRRDGGDAEEGSGVEVGGRLRYASSWGLSLEASLRALLAHEASVYEEWGASGALRYDPGRAGIGLTASVTPTWGTATSGIGRLWSQPDARGLAGGGAGLSASPAARVDAELGWGLRTLNGQGLLTPYARASLVEGSEQAWHLGTRMALAESLNVSLEATHRQRPDEAAAQEVALLVTVPW